MGKNLAFWGLLMLVVGTVQGLQGGPFEQERKKRDRSSLRHPKDSFSIIQADDINGLNLPGNAFYDDATDSYYIGSGNFLATEASSIHKYLPDEKELIQNWCSLPETVAVVLGLTANKAMVLATAHDVESGPVVCACLLHSGEYVGSYQFAQHGVTILSDIVSDDKDMVYMVDPGFKFNFQNYEDVTDDLDIDDRYTMTDALWSLNLRTEEAEKILDVTMDGFRNPISLLMDKSSQAILINHGFDENKIWFLDFQTGQIVSRFTAPSQGVLDRMVRFGRKGLNEKQYLLNFVDHVSLTSTLYSFEAYEDGKFFELMSEVKGRGLEFDSKRKMLLLPDFSLLKTLLNNIVWFEDVSTDASLSVVHQYELVRRA